MVRVSVRCRLKWQSGMRLFCDRFMPDRVSLGMSLEFYILKFALYAFHLVVRNHLARVYRDVA